jgi:hypothetical protein
MTGGCSATGVVKPNELPKEGVSSLGVKSMKAFNTGVSSGIEGVSETCLGS